MPFLGETLRVRRTATCRVTETCLAGGAALPTHEHHTPYVSFVLAGGYTEWHGEVERRCRPGVVLWHAPHEIHRNAVDPGGAHVVNLELAEPAALGAAATPTAHATTLGLALFRALAAPDRDLDETACELWAAAEPDDRRLDRPIWLRRAVELIGDELDQPLRLADLAARLGVHPVHVARTFRRVLNTTVGAHVAEARVLRACELLRWSRPSIADIAAASGFADHAHLTRTFRRLVGMTPSEYRAGRG